MAQIQSKLLFLLVLSSMLITSCVNETMDSPTTASHEVDLRITLQMPAASVPTTYALSDIDENKIHEIDVLVFLKNTTTDKWEYAYRAQGNSIKDADTSAADLKRAKKQFTVKLLRKEVAQCLVILANTRSEILTLGATEGDDKEALLARLTVTNTEQWSVHTTTFTPFPMWGEVTQVISESQTISNVKMLRALARIDVLLHSDIITSNRFVLNSVSLLNRNTVARITPNTDNLDASNTKAVEPTLPTLPTPIAGPLIYYPPNAAKVTNLIYLFEAAEQADYKEATCIVVGGKYNGDTNYTYYRIDFLDATTNKSMPILRNHKYEFTITRILGRGFNSISDAFAAPGVNMTAELKHWNDGEAGDMYFDNYNYLSVKSEALQVFDEDSGTKTVRVQTDVEAGFEITAITDEQGSPIPTVGGWVQIDQPLKVPLGTSEAVVPIEISVENLSAIGVRQAHLHIEAGNLKAVIRVVQENSLTKRFAKNNHSRYGGM